MRLTDSDSDSYSSSLQEHLVLMGFPVYERLAVGNLRFPLVSLDGLTEASLKKLAGNESRSEFIIMFFIVCCLVLSLSLSQF